MTVDTPTPGEQGPRHPHPNLGVPALLRHHHQGQGGGQVHGPRRRQGIAHQIFFFSLKISRGGSARGAAAARHLPQERALQEDQGGAAGAGDQAGAGHRGLRAERGGGRGHRDIMTT